MKKETTKKEVGKGPDPTIYGQRMNATFHKGHAVPKKRTLKCDECGDTQANSGVEFIRRDGDLICENCDEQRDEDEEAEEWEDES